ncbi:DUF2637 domain-containing protein [Polymorphospora lycopeni]|uniref:DUF2637 domain-containing protein n=1 Tax=Polymorphospora lycopeni TaxID=3140240 RepID=A0ABV5CKD0_9ACTN
MLAIGGAAGAASFTHVRDVAAAHGQPGWLAWADAIVLELMSIASGLELRRRKRAGKSTVFPATVLACAVTLSLAAQVVEAEPSPIGWIAAAVPALGFLVMVKIALGYADTASATKQTGPVPSDAHAGDRPTTETAPQDGRDLSATPVPDRTVPERTVHQPGRDRRPSGPDHHKTSGPPHQRRPVRRGPSHGGPASLDELLAAARHARERLAAEARPLTRAALAEALRTAGFPVSNTRASHLLKILKTEQPPAPAAPVPDRPVPAAGLTPAPLTNPSVRHPAIPHPGDATP